MRLLGDVKRVIPDQVVRAPGAPWVMSVCR